MFRKKATHFFKFTQKIFHASFWHLFARSWDDNDVKTQRFSDRSTVGIARPTLVPAQRLSPERPARRPPPRRLPMPSPPAASRRRAIAAAIGLDRLRREANVPMPRERGRSPIPAPPKKTAPSQKNT